MSFRSAFPGHRIFSTMFATLLIVMSGWAWALPQALPEDPKPRATSLRAGSSLEIHAPDAAANSKPRVVVRSGGGQSRLDTADTDEVGQRSWRYSPHRPGTLVVATVTETPGPNGGTYRSDKLFVRIAPENPAAVASDGPSAGATARFGHRFEITPLVDPTRLAIGTDLPVRVRFDGGGAPGATVRLTMNPGGSMAGRIRVVGTAPPDEMHGAGVDDQVQRSETVSGDGGVFIVPITGAGMWTIEVEHRVAGGARPGARVDPEARDPGVFLASMRFVVGQAPAPVLPVPPVQKDLAPLGAGGPQWQSLGPAPIGGVEYTGRVAAIAVSPSDPDTYFVGGADGGVWRTTDGGATWTALTDDMPTTAIGALAIDPLDENVIYAGTGEANFAYHSRFGLGLLKSTDAGNTWSLLAGSTFAGRCFSRIAIDPGNSSVLYASITNAGGFIPAPGSAAKGHPLANDPVGVYKSIDGGAIWTLLTGGLPATTATDVAIDPSDPQTVYAAIGHIFGSPDNGVYKSTDGGANWLKLGGGLPVADVGRISLAVAPSSPQRIIAAVTQVSTSTGGSALTNGVFRSDNGGTTWAPISPGNYMSSFGWYLNVVTVQPTNPDVVLVGGVTSHRSANAGTSWTTITPPHVDHHAFAWDASGRLLAGVDGGLYRSNTLGGSWEPLNDGLGLVQFYAGVSFDPTNPEVIFGGTQDNGTNKRVGPDSWIHVLGADGGYTAVNPDNPSIVFAEFQGTGNFFRSTNSGLNWGSSSSGISGADRNCFLPPFGFDPSDSMRMAYGTHRVYESLNGGVNWLPISGDLTATPTGAIHSIAIALTDSRTIWVTTNDGNVQVTFDGGVSWTLVRTGLPGWFRVMRQVFVSPESNGEAYIAGSSFGTDQVLRTIDGGQNWSVLDGDLPDVPVNVISVDTYPVNDMIFAGTEAGVYRSLDDGVTWLLLGTGLPNAVVIDLQVDQPRRRLIATTQGRGAWSIGLCPRDIDGSGDVGIDDFLAVLANWGSCRGTCPADTDNDGTVGILDFLGILASWGPCDL